MVAAGLSSSGRPRSGPRVFGPGELQGPALQRTGVEVAMRSNPAQPDASVHSAPRAGSGSGEAVSTVDQAGAKVVALRNLKRLEKTDPRVIPNDDFVGRYMALRELRG